MKNEQLDWPADKPLDTKRFAFVVGRQCRQTTLKEVAEELCRDGHAVQEWDQQYRREQLRRAGNAAPRVLGSDAIALANGHRSRIFVSDWERGRPLWFGGPDRSTARLDECYRWLGPAKGRQSRLAVLDLGKAFRNTTLQEGNAPQAAIWYDQFPILTHPGEAMDQVRKREYVRWSGAARRFVKGQRYMLLAHGGNLTAEGRAALKLPFKDHKRLNQASLLQESFGPWWDYRSRTWARRFLDPWRDALRGQR